MHLFKKLLFCSFIAITLNAYAAVGDDRFTPSRSKQEMTNSIASPSLDKNSDQDSKRNASAANSSNAIKEATAGTYLDKFINLKLRDKYLVLGTVGMVLLVVFGFTRFLLTGKQ